MVAFKKLCENYFATSDFYEILGVERDATAKEIRKAYHKKSLIVHPDKVAENQKEVANEKFKLLSKIHSILEDPEKRKIYDETGNIDDEHDPDFDWSKYWRSLFKKITVNDIDKFKTEYIGSEDEIRDLKRAYIKTKGDMNKIIEIVFFGDCDSEARYQEIIQKLVDNGEVEKYSKFFHEPESKKKQRQKKMEKERQEAEDIDMDELVAQMEKNKKKRSEELGDFLANLEAKYANKKRKAVTDESAAKNKKPKKTNKK